MHIQPGTVSYLTPAIATACAIGLLESHLNILYIMLVLIMYYVVMYKLFKKDHSHPVYLKILH